MAHDLRDHDPEGEGVDRALGEHEGDNVGAERAFLAAEVRRDPDPDEDEEIEDEEPGHSSEVKDNDRREVDAVERLEVRDEEPELVEHEEGRYEDQGVREVPGLIEVARGFLSDTLAGNQRRGAPSRHALERLDDLGYGLVGSRRAGGDANAP